MTRLTSILIGVLLVACVATTGVAADKLKKIDCTTGQIARFDGVAWVCSDALTQNERAISDETAARRAADDDLQNQIDQLAGSAKTYAGSAFAASIDEGGESWYPNYEGYGFMAPPEDRTWPNAVAQVTLNIDVQLPDGAEVTEFSCYWYDNDAQGNIELLDANLFRREVSGVDKLSLARISRLPATTGPPLDAIQSGVIDDIIAPIIDNVTFSYYINVVFSLGETTPVQPSDIRWYGCQVRYQMPD